MDDQRRWPQAARQRHAQALRKCLDLPPGSLERAHAFHAAQVLGELFCRGLSAETASSEQWQAARARVRAEHPVLTKRIEGDR